MAEIMNPIEGASDLCRLSAQDLASRFAEGTLSPVEIATAALDRAEAINPKLNAFSFLDREGALKAARASEDRWRRKAPLSPVDGVPTTIKDIVWVDGWTVRYGSRTTDAAPFTEDAPAVARLRQAGCTFIGQTTTPEFGWKAVTDNPLHGITRNPWNPDLTPGGSSGGAAVAAATGAGVFHIGTDGGGSIRIPASFSGIAGLKPSFGRVAAHPPSVFGTVAHVGPMARTAADLAAMLGAMAGRDARDWNQGPAVLASLTPSFKGIAGAKIGYWRTSPIVPVAGDVAVSVDAAVERLRGAGAEVTVIDLPWEGDLLSMFNRHWLSSAAARVKAVDPTMREWLDPDLLAAAADGAIPATDLVAAQTDRVAYGRNMDRLLTEFDFVVSPATPITAFAAGLQVPPGSGLKRWIEWACFAFPINLSQQPAAVVPADPAPSGLPVGFQIIGPRGGDANVLALAAAFERLEKESCR